MVSKLKLDIIIQSELKKSVSNFDEKSLQRVRLWFNNFKIVRFSTKFLERFRFSIENYYVLLGFALKGFLNKNKVWMKRFENRIWW